MIARLVGRLVEKSPESLVIDVHGVGYEVFTSLNTFYSLPDAGTTVDLQIHTHMRENALELFGFREPLEKSVFTLLLGVSGVGPRMALAILSGMTATDLLEALDDGDVARLVSVPGVGKKRAERLIVELKDRVQPPARRHPRAPRRDRVGDRDRSRVGARQSGLSQGGRGAGGAPGDAGRDG